MNAEDFISAIDTVAMFSEDESVSGKKYRSVDMTIQPGEGGESGFITFSGVSASYGTDSSAMVPFRHNSPDTVQCVFDPADILGFARRAERRRSQLNSGS